MLPKSKKQHSIPIIPIENFFNTCFINSFLQAIVHLNIFQLIQNNHSSIYQKQLFSLLNNYVEGIYISKEQVKIFIEEQNLKYGEQSDIYDVFSFFLNNLEEETKENFITGYSESIKCQECNYIIKKTHLLNILNVYNNKDLNFQLDKYFNDEICEFNCNNCNKLSTHVFTKFNTNLPKILLIHIIKDINTNTINYDQNIQIKNLKYNLNSIVCRTGLDYKGGHFFNILISDTNYIKVSDCNIELMNCSYNKDAIYLIYKMQSNNATLKRDMKLKYIYIDNKKNRLLCPTCSKLISTKHIVEHHNNIHKQEVSLMDYHRISRDLTQVSVKKNTISCPFCEKPYASTYIRRHISNCKIRGYSSTYYKEKKILDCDGERELYNDMIDNMEFAQISENFIEKVNKSNINTINSSEMNKKYISEVEQDFTTNSEPEILRNRDFNINNEIEENTTYELKLNSINELESRNSLHDNTTHNLNIIQKENNSNKQRYTCEHCQKVLSIKNKRQHYSRYHPQILTEYFYKCDIKGCQLSYPTKAGRSFHQKKHHINEYLNINFKSFNSKRIEINTKLKEDSKTFKSEQETKETNNYCKDKKTRKPVSTKQLIYNITGLSYENFCVGSNNKIEICKTCPIFISKQKLPILNKEFKTIVYKLVTKELISKYGRDIGSLPTSRVNIKPKPLNKLTTENLNNIINNVIKDTILLTNKYSNIYNNKKVQNKPNIQQNVPAILIKELINRNYTKFKFMIKNEIKSNERILLYRELISNNLDVNNINMWKENERNICYNILDKLFNYEKNKDKLDEETIKLRDKFERNTSKCIENIIKNKNTVCQIKEKKLLSEFKNRFSNPKFKHISNKKELPEWWESIYASLPNEKDAMLFQDYNYITELEFDQMLSHMKAKSSPGPDGVTYSLIKHCEGVKIIVRKILNTCLFFGFVPDNFLFSTVILADKNKDDKEDINNWRPICLSNTISKLLTKWISNKIYSINDILKIRNKSIFSEEQRGFQYNINGCSDYSNILKAIYEDSKRSTPKNKIQRITNVAIDFKDAFTAIPHYVMHSILEIFKIPKTMKKIIVEYYKHSYFYIKQGKETLKEKIYIEKGVKQGDPLSPILFNMALEPLLRMIKNTKIGYRFKNSDMIIGILSYADDVLLLSNDIHEMGILLKELEKYCIWAEIDVNHNKCEASSSFQLENGEIGSVMTNIYINNNRIPDAGYNGQFKYLGAYISNEYRNIVDNTNTITHEIEEQILLLSNTKLSAIQKIKAVKFYILPKLEFIMKNSYIDVNELIRMDNLIRNFIKEWLYLPNNFVSDIFYLPWYDGGLGIFKLEERYVIGKVVSYIKLYNSNSFIGNIIKYNQIQYEKNCNIHLSNSNTDFLNWIKSRNAETDRTHQTSFISKVYNGCRKFNIKLKYNDDMNIYLEINDIDTENNKNRKFNNDYDYLNELLRQNRIKKFSLKKYQSSKRDIMINNSTDNFMLKEIKLLNDNLMRNMLLSRTDTFPTNHNKQIWYGKTDISIYCKKCPSKIHNLYHILQDCKNNLPFYKDRHDNACSIVYNYVKRQKNYEVYYDHNQRNIFEFYIPEEINLLRPDMLLVNRKISKIIILEVAFFYYNSNIDKIIENKETFKYNKYKKLIEYYKTKNYATEYYTLLFDSTGFIINNTKNHIIQIFQELKLRKSYIQLFHQIVTETMWNTSRLLNNIRSYLSVKL